MSELIHGRYDVVRSLGSGAMGVVVEARDRSDGRHVALKMPRMLALHQPESAERFRREAATMASLHHPNIVGFFGFFESPPVLVLELLHGESVSQLLRRERVMSLPSAASIGMQICSGLAAAHAVGVVHRDVKPSNLFLHQPPNLPACAKLIDFGVAKHAGRDAAPLTAQSAIVGSALYMSPEQIRGEPAEARSDLFALGLCLYEMVTGVRPYADDSPHLAMVRILQGDPLPPHLALPAGLHNTLLRATSREPSARYQSAVELARALQPFSKREVAATQMSLVAASEPAAPTPLRVSSVPPPPASSMTRVDNPREHPSSSRYGTQPMQSVRAENLSPSSTDDHEPSPASMTTPLAYLPAELAERLTSGAAARRPPASVQNTRVIPAAPPPLPPAPSSSSWKLAVGISAAVAAAGLAGAGYWWGVHEADAAPPPSSAAPASSVSSAPSLAPVPTPPQPALEPAHAHPAPSASVVAKPKRHGALPSGGSNLDLRLR